MPITIWGRFVAVGPWTCPRSGTCLPCPRRAVRDGAAPLVAGRTGASAPPSRRSSAGGVKEQQVGLQAETSAAVFVEDRPSPAASRISKQPSIAGSSIGRSSRTSPVISTSSLVRPSGRRPDSTTEPAPGLPSARTAPARRRVQPAAPSSRARAAGRCPAAPTVRQHGSTARGRDSRTQASAGRVISRGRCRGDPTRPADSKRPPESRAHPGRTL